MPKPPKLKPYTGHLCKKPKETKNHIETNVVCSECGHEWIAIHEQTHLPFNLECPSCHKMNGEPFAPGIGENNES